MRHENELECVIVDVCAKMLNAFSKANSDCVVYSKVSVEDYVASLRSELPRFSITDSDMAQTQLIIDNMPLPRGITINDKYITMLEIRAGVATFLRGYEINLLEYLTNLLSLHCQNTNNMTDCEIYCMRHLKSCKRNPNDCDCDIPKINAMILNLRTRMTLAILLSASHKNMNNLVSLVMDLLFKHTRT